MTSYVPEDPDEPIDSVREKLKAINRGIVSEAWKRLIDSVENTPTEEDDDGEA